jgi:alpha-beta hydrolase superfamily lysophospholipase
MTLPDVRLVDNGAGWRIALKRTPAAGRALGAVLLVPGYGMNSFIFSFHPSGPSLEAYLASRGLDVYSVDLRAQGRAENAGGHKRFGLGELAVDDLGAAIAGVREWSGKEKVDIVGCSLGAALAFAHVACVPGAPVRALVSLGGLVTWVDPHLLVRIAFASPRLVGMVPMGGTRTLAGYALPIAARVAPGLLSLYMHAQSTDLSHAPTMVNTVEDPTPHMNREIAEWIGRRELVVRGVNVSRALPGMDNPVLCVVANQDGIVPPATGRAIYDEVGSPRKELVCVGDATLPIAHADLFVARGAQERVFAPIAAFLKR